MYQHIKSLHLIFVITAGLPGYSTLFVYLCIKLKHVTNLHQKEILQKQYKIMTYRLWYIITWPSAVLATFFAAWLLYLMPAWLQMPWMHVKLGFVVLLFAYHFKCQNMYTQLQNEEEKYTSNFMRLWNEGATIILFAVVFLVILQNVFNRIFGVIGIILFSVLIMLGFQFYKRIREKKQLPAQSPFTV